MKADPAYRLAFDEAWEIGCRTLEGLAFERASEGVQEPVFWKGKQCGSITRYYHLEFLLRGAMAQKYSTRQEVTGPNGGPVQSEIIVKFVSADGSPISRETPVPLPTEEI